MTRWGVTLMLVIATPVTAGADAIPQPRLTLAFTGCPTSYGVLVRRIAHLELGVPLLLADEEEADYSAGVTCAGDSVRLTIRTPFQIVGTVRLDLSDEMPANRPRIVGLRVGELFAEALVDWVGPEQTPAATAFEAPPPSPPPSSAAAAPAAPSPSPLPPSPAAAAVTADEPKPATQPVPESTSESTLLAPAEEVKSSAEDEPTLRLFFSGGLFAMGAGPQWSPRLLAGVGYDPGLPVAFAVDIAVRFAQWSQPSGVIEATLITAGIFVEWVPIEVGRFGVRVGLGWRGGSAQLTGKATSGNRGGEVIGLWLSPAVRACAKIELGSFEIALDLAGGYTTLPVVGVVDAEREVGFEGVWFGFGVGVGMAGALLTSPVLSSSQGP